ncbi:putative MFS general substrate transporter [Rosellinia necatrix]|uniref:Putative MFS general substrate transporter n=1 Tax=Rosellinia necatrix TaxID=77044 RepID=A0A1W2TGF2_ROSNE|nr:putative MFS general substrate transporter [Rosellinia necatrix]
MMDSAYTSEKDGTITPDNTTQQHVTKPEYPPKDKGTKAWLFLIGASIVEITAWGFPFAYGVFREYFFTHPPFEGADIVSTGGLLANGVLQICVPVVIYVLNYLPRQRKNAMWLGCFFCTISPISAAFTTSPAVLVVLLGPLYGIGAGLLFAPSMHFMDDWFLERKSFAYGIICAAGSAAGAGLSPVYAIALRAYGHKVTLIAMGLITLLVTAGGLCLVHPRTPPEKALKPTRADFDFLRKPLFLIFLAATIVQSSSNYGPNNYLPSIGADFGLTSTQGALLVSLLNIAQAFGQPLQGAIADTKASFYTSLLISTLGGSASCLLIWPFARKFWSLIVFAVLFGLFVPGFAVLRPRFAAAVIGKDERPPIQQSSCEGAEEVKAEADVAKQRNKSLLIFGIFTAARGIAVVAAGFVSVALVHEDSEDLSGYGLGTRWRGLILYTGITLGVSSFAALGRLVPRDTRD